MSIQFQHAVASRLAPQSERTDAAAHRALLRALILAGETTARAWLPVALLRFGDAAINERLAGLRGRLDEVETAAVWREFADCDGTLSGDFIADWRNLV